MDKTLETLRDNGMNVNLLIRNHLLWMDDWLITELLPEKEEPVEKTPEEPKQMVLSFVE